MFRSYLILLINIGKFDVTFSTSFSQLQKLDVTLCLSACNLIPSHC